MAVASRFLFRTLAALIGEALRDRVARREYPPDPRCSLTAQPQLRNEGHMTTHDDPGVTRRLSDPDDQETLAPEGIEKPDVALPFADARE